MDYTTYIIYAILILFIIDFIRNQYKCNINKHFAINTLMRGCARWATASLQDKSPVISVLHANYAAGYLWAIKDIFSYYDIKIATNIDIIEFQKKITDVQDKATQFIISTCPQYGSDINTYFGKIAGEYN